jgi:hypothetical protein
MLRQAQHERKLVSQFKRSAVRLFDKLRGGSEPFDSPFVLSLVEGTNGAQDRLVEG